MQAILILCLLGAILGANGVRIGGPRFGIYPSEPKLEFYNPLTPGVPPPVMEDSEPENRLLQQPPGPKVPGLQIENVVQALRYRYPDPTTTPRPFSAAALYPIHPDSPTAYAQRRPDPLPTPPPTRVQQVLLSPDGSLITGNQIDLTEYQSPHQQAQAQAIQQQAQIIQQQRQSQLASQQLQQAQQRLQQRLLMRQRLRQMILQQQQDDALRQQQQQAQQLGQPQFSSADLSQVQPALQAVQPEFQQDLNQQFQAVQQPAQADFHQTFQPALESLIEHPIEQQPAVLPLAQPPPATSGVSFSRTYHVSRVTDHQK